MVEEIRKRVGDNVPLVTENNAEVYMDQVEGFLTLNAFAGSLATPTDGSLQPKAYIVPSFPAIYGKCLILLVLLILIRNHSFVIHNPHTTLVNPLRCLTYDTLSSYLPHYLGGYYNGFGAEFYSLDFNDHNWMRAKLAVNFNFGAQIGKNKI